MYERTVAFKIWIKRSDGTLVHETFEQTLILPISKKTYKVTLKNIKVYIEELMQQDLDIAEVQIDRISSVGLVKRRK